MRHHAEQYAASATIISPVGRLHCTRWTATLRSPSAQHQRCGDGRRLVVLPLVERSASQHAYTRRLGDPVVHGHDRRSRRSAAAARPISSSSSCGDRSAGSGHRAVVVRLSQLRRAAPDTTPPSVPQGLRATVVSSTRIDLNWSASTDAAQRRGGLSHLPQWRGGRDQRHQQLFEQRGSGPGPLHASRSAPFDGATPANESVQSAAVTATTPQGSDRRHRSASMRRGRRSPTRSASCGRPTADSTPA